MTHKLSAMMRILYGIAVIFCFQFGYDAVSGIKR